jgi:aminodeoxyfutalosine deaminase
MRPSTLLALARRNRVELPASDLGGLRRWFEFRDFDHFVSVYVACSEVLREPEDFERLVLDFLEEQARQHILYSEVHFTISTHVARGLDGDEVLEALDAGRRLGRERFGADLTLIPDIVRNMPVDRADVTLAWALEARSRGLAVALGLSGVEAGFSDRPFQEHFERATREGLHRVVHAGEQAGPKSVRSALEVLGAERIGHGVRAVEDPDLVAELAARRIPLEVCPTSNLRLGVFPDLESHSFDRLHRAGVQLSVGSDDPSLFNTTLTCEYRKLARTFGYPAEELAGFALAGLRQSFLPAARKTVFEEELKRRFRELGERHLGRPVEPAVEASYLERVSSPSP